MITRNEHSGAGGESGLTGLELRTVWNVSQGPAYDVRRDAPPESDLLVAIRTHGGLGRILLRSGSFDLAPGTLFLTRNTNILRYHCAASKWAFWWFEFASQGALPCALEEEICTPLHPAIEAARVSEITTALRSPSPARRVHASAGLAWLLTRWLADRTNPPGPPVRYRDTLERIVETMYQRVHGNWSVAEMAAEAGMSERLFRNAFTKVTGRSPKAFYLGLRLDTAMEHLRQGRTSVKELADQLGFSSPYHLSREFTRRFKTPPSAFLRNRMAPQMDAPAKRLKT